MAKDASQPNAGGDGGARKTSVFVSYARKDSSEAAKALVAALIDTGFDAYLDQKDITPGEDWRKRLGDLVLAADTIVFLISPCSVTSEACLWEISEAERLSKRLIPAVWKSVPDDEIPASWSRRNYVFLDNEATRHAQFEKLADAIRTDVIWVREHTRLGGLAERWDGKGRSSALLLRGHELEEAERWTAARPHNAPMPSPKLIEFLAAGRSAGTRRQRLLLGGALAAVILSIGAAILFATQSAENARLAVAEAEQRKIAQQNEVKATSSADRAKEALKIANEQREKADANALRAVSTQSVAISTLAQRHLENGDATTAALVALEALPGEVDGVQRPYEPEIERTLYRSAYQLNEILSAEGSDAFFDAATDALVTIDLPSAFVIHDNRSAAPSKRIVTGGTIALRTESVRDLVVSVSNTAIEFWRTRDGTLLKSCAFASEGEFSRPGILATFGDRLAILDSASGDAFYSILDLATCKIEDIAPPFDDADKSFPWFDGDWNSPQAAFTSDGSAFFVASEKGAIWDTRTRKPLFFLDDYPWPQDVRFGRKSSIAIARSTERDGNSVKAWSLAERKAIAKNVMHDTPMRHMVLLADDQTVISSGTDQSVRAWNVKSETKPLALPGFDRDVRRIYVNAPGTCFLTIDTGGTVRAWTLDLQNYFSYQADTFKPVTGHISSDCTRVSMSDGRIVRVVSVDERARNPAFFIAGTLPEDKKNKEPSNIRFEGNSAFLAFGNKEKDTVWWDVPGMQTSRLTSNISDRTMFANDKVVQGVCVDSPLFGDETLRAEILPVIGNLSLRVYGTDGAVPADFAGMPPNDGLRCSSSNGRHVIDIPVWGQRSSAKVTSRPFPDATISSCEWRGFFDGIWKFIAGGDKLARLHSDIDIVDAATCASIVTFSGLRLTYGDGQNILAAMSEHGDAVATYEKDHVRIYRIYGSLIDLATAVKMAVPRCLDSLERELARLDLNPPRWCITGSGNENETDPAKWSGKWPYHTDAWKSWLVAADAARAKGEAVPPMPAAETPGENAQTDALTAKNVSADEPPGLVAPPAPAERPVADPAAGATGEVSAATPPPEPAPAALAPPMPDVSAPTPAPVPASQETTAAAPQPPAPDAASASSAAAATPSAQPAEPAATATPPPAMKPAPGAAQAAASPAPPPKKPRKAKKVEDSIPAPFPLP